MKTFEGVLAAVAFIMLWVPGAEAAPYSGGTGSNTDPYQIASGYDWGTLTITPADWGKHFVLLADIDFTGAALSPVGNDTIRFTGLVEGNGHALHGGVIDATGNDSIGLFGCVGITGEIRNLSVKLSSVKGRYYVGGLAGANYGSLSSCHATCFVMGDSFVAGLVGYNGGGTIIRCSATGTAQGNTLSSNVGGLAGFNDGGTIVQSYAGGTVESIDSAGNVGGLVGYNSGMISSSYATNRVNGKIVVGGLVGLNVGSLITCYSMGPVTGETREVGGLVGANHGSTVSFCYWDQDSSGQTESSGGEGRTTLEMTSPHAENAYTGWDFASVWVEDTGHVANNGYPYLLENAPPYEPNSGTACGCCRAAAKQTSWKQLLERAPGDWLLIGLGILTLMAYNVRCRLF